MRYVLSLVLLLFVPVILLAQSKEQLEKERKKLIQEIEKTKKYLDSTVKSKQTTLKDLKAISAQVDNRKKLITTISGEISASDRKIEDNNQKIDSLSINLGRLNEQYLQMQRYTYLRQLSNNKWSYLLSSGNLNTFLLRWRYSSQFESFNEKKQAEINQLRAEIQSNTLEITKVKEEKGKLLEQEKKEATTLEKEKLAKDKMLKEISSKESTLKKELEKKKGEREKLNAAIERVINEQLRLAREKASASSSANTGNSKSDKKETKLDDASIKLAAEFSQNKNKLPWPISSGFVSSGFGVQAHPTIKGVTIENNGIDITGKGSKDVKCVFNGEVVGVTKVPGYNYMVIVRHGNYYSVYSNLSSVSVKQGSKLNGQQSIGSITADENGDAELHFELWKDKTKLNPEAWLR
ncbi:MAG: peptidoglycan DD-metalloendopeptidase family protein [Saprospiraceae bacterium]|nr:peptidoglycan DD-metalloendopeptidase family protein [Saprospiraceae bacterium]MBK8848733.1 peptidoglycan DD-metalloendopeptidase family protein [Saprospiraceae bacterium]MBL0084402.1 peptidoglycan DD-metalloendopeptidase family protein [Saprospiraceae bacterium]HRG20067.1 peptidoglycan DD-metalloendopeptidase family protein [Saprospiraceae bacterium]